MKTNFNFPAQQVHFMEKNLSLKPFKLFTCLFLLLSGILAQGQNASLFLTWDTEVGCTFSGNDRDLKDFFELIADGESLEVCNSTLVAYNLHGMPANWLSITWNVAGGTMLTPQNQATCKVQWGNGSIGLVGATVTTATDIIVMPDLNISLIKKPKAQFWKAPFNFNTAGHFDLSAGINVCAGETFTLANGSSANGGSEIAEYYWDFGDTRTSTEREPTLMYPDSGTEFWVTLTVTNDCNCKHSTKVLVRVGKKSVNIVCPAVVCEGQTATYSIKGLDRHSCDPFKWSVIGGVITSAPPYSNSIDVLWTPSGQNNGTLDGFGYVSFDPERCGLDCYVETHLKIPVITDNMAFEGPTSVCGSTQTRFTMPQWPTTDFQWEVINTNGTNASVVITDQRNEVILNPGTVSGTVTLRVTYQNTLLNCGGTSERKIEVKNDAIITGPREACVGSTVVYNVAPEESVTWTLRHLPNGTTTTGTGHSFSPNFIAAGNYSLSIIGNNICSGEAIIIKVISPAVPLNEHISDSDGVDNARIVCPSEPSTFTNSHQIPGTVIGWSIAPGVGTIVGSNYGDQIQVIFNHPTVPPNAPYILYVWRETMTNPACKSEELQIPLAPEDLDLAISGEQDPCGSTRHQYTLPTSVVADTYEWSIQPPEAGSIVSNGGNSIWVLWNQFAALKIADIKVKATKCNIPETSDLYRVRIDNPRIAMVVPTAPICPGVYQDFSITSSVQINNPDSDIIWDFGDGSPSQAGASVEHQFINSGTYNVRVRVIEPNGCSLTLTETTQVIVHPKPVVFVSPSYNEVCSPNLINVTLTANAGPGVTSLNWYWAGSPNTVLGTTNEITGNVYGEYYVVASNGTCTSSSSAQIVDCQVACIPSPVPVLGLTLEKTCSNITATGTYIPQSNPAPTDYFWDSNFLTDELILPTNLNTATFSYIEPGYHTIKYGVAYNNQNCFTYEYATKFIPYIAKVGTTVACGTTGNYNVTILDQSLVYPGVTINSYTFELDGIEIPLGSNPANTRVVEIPGGQHIIRLTILATNHDPCTVELTINLPVYPNATFTVSQNPVCQENSTIFTANEVAGQTYLWEFGDGTTNLQPKPEKEYQDAIGYFATLVVSNAYCDASWGMPITVNANKQAGRIETPQIGCSGESSTLEFTPSGLPTSSMWQWLLNNQPIPGATANPYEGITVPGKYSIIVGATNGCTKRISQSIAVAIANPAFSSIQGPATVCVNLPFTLFVKAGISMPGVVYEWRRIEWPHLIWSALPSITVDGLPAGSYTYALTVKTPIAAGGFCTTVLYHTVRVVEPAIVTALSGTVTKCDPFEVTLIASADQPGGVFNWSNGSFGSQVTDTNGGAFRVTYTSEAGCKTTAQVTAPKNPDNYMWIFPYGCYTFCETFNTGTLIGPSIAYFDKWDWLLNAAEELSGSGNDMVAPYDLGSIDGIYNLRLETSPCKVTSKDMIVDIIECACEISAEYHSVEIKKDPFDHYLLTIFIANSTGANQTVTVAAPNDVGVITPGFVTVPNGGGLFTFMVIPETGYNGGSFLIKFSGTSPESLLCRGFLEVSLPPLEPIEGIQNSGNIIDQNAYKLTLIPNPATDQTQLHYDFGSTQSQALQLLEVYDIYGRQLDAKTATTSSAIWNLNTSGYEAGIYIIVMKRDGKIVQQKNLIITP